RKVAVLPAPTQWRQGAARNPKSGHTDDPISTPTLSRRGEKRLSRYFERIVPECAKPSLMPAAACPRESEGRHDVTPAQAGVQSTAGPVTWVNATAHCSNCAPARCGLTSAAVLGSCNYSPVSVAPGCRAGCRFRTRSEIARGLVKWAGHDR